MPAARRTSTLLDEHPAAFNHLLRIVAQAKWASDYLLRHPIVLDELLDGQLLEPFDCVGRAGSCANSWR